MRNPLRTTTHKPMFRGTTASRRIVTTFALACILSVSTLSSGCASQTDQSSSSFSTMTVQQQRKAAIGSPIPPALFKAEAEAQYKNRMQFGGPSPNFWPPLGGEPTSGRDLAKEAPPGEKN